MLRNAGGSETRCCATWPPARGLGLAASRSPAHDARRGSLELDLDGIAVHLIYVGPAHTAGDVIVHLPAARVVFTGDVLFRLCTPSAGGTYERWIAALDEIVALDPAVVVPATAALGVEGRARCSLPALRAREAKRGFDAGLPALDAARRIDSALHRLTQPERILFQVERATASCAASPTTRHRRDRALPRMHALRESRRAVA